MHVCNHANCYIPVYSYSYNMLKVRCHVAFCAVSMHDSTENVWILLKTLNYSNVLVTFVDHLCLHFSISSLHGQKTQQSLLFKKTSYALVTVVTANYPWLLTCFVCSTTADQAYIHICMSCCILRNCMQSYMHMHNMCI